MSAGMHVSFGEAQDLCLKAARGAGLDWGLAEEAGFAARWLLKRGLDGPGCLLAHLLTVDDGWGDTAFDDGAISSASGAPVSPLIAGPAIADAAAKTDKVAVNPVHKPLLLLPFLHLSTAAVEESALLAWADKCVAVTPSGQLMGAVEDLDALDIAKVKVTFEQQSQTAEFESKSFCLTDATIAGLTNFASNTWVPATDASRADAGSSDGDND